ncbi:acyltransferase family protein [Kitasatospora arboriphila]
MSAPTAAADRTETPDPDTGADPDTAEAPGRQPLFDNAKFAAVALVVCAHTWMPLAGADRTVAAAVLTVAAFAMPVFVTLCGRFAQPRPGRPAVDGRRLVTGVAVPYLVFQVLYNLVGMALEGRFAPFSLLEPRWLTWFLLSLFAWRLTVPLWTALRHPLAVAVLVAAASGAARALPEELALSRTLAFLPWFVLGLVLRPHHVALLRRHGLALGPGGAGRGLRGAVARRPRAAEPGLGGVHRQRRPVARPVPGVAGRQGLARTAVPGRRGGVPGPAAGGPDPLDGAGRGLAPRLPAARAAAEARPGLRRLPRPGPAPRLDGAAPVRHLRPDPRGGPRPPAGRPPLHPAGRPETRRPPAESTPGGRTTRGAGSGAIRERAARRPRPTGVHRATRTRTARFPAPLRGR